MLYVWRIASIVGFVLLVWTIFILSGEQGRQALQTGREFAQSAISHPHWLEPVEPAGSTHDDDNHLKHPETLSTGSTTNEASQCPSRKPNLILTSTDSTKWEDQIFVFMQSLEMALGADSLAAQRAESCPPAPVVVKVIVPQDLIEPLPAGFNALEQRYPSLEFVAQLPEAANSPIWIRRFGGYATYLDRAAATSVFGKVLVVDLDVAFQRNPFSMTLSQGTDILFFAEWRGLSIGQCSIHTEWFEQCARAENEATISPGQARLYKHRERIGAGSTFGTAKAVKVYVDTMARQLKASKWQCNDQATHAHLYYSNMLSETLEDASLGSVKLVADDEALFGNIGTTPFVTFNEWGEVLNEKGQVQVAVHQYETHRTVAEIVQGKYGWAAQVGRASAIPTVPELVQDSGASSGSGSGSISGSPAASSGSPSQSKDSFSNAGPSSMEDEDEASSHVGYEHMDIHAAAAAAAADVEREPFPQHNSHSDSLAHSHSRFARSRLAHRNATSDAFASSASTASATASASAQADTHAHTAVNNIHASLEQPASADADEDVHAHHAPPSPEEVGAGLLYTQYRLAGADGTTCAAREDLCSCKYVDCQPHYEAYCGRDRKCTYPVVGLA